MKTSRFATITLLSISLGLLGCGEIETPVEPTPEEEKSEITIDADIITNGLSYTSAKGEKSFSFTTNEDWTLSIATTPSGDTWCTASATSGAKGNANVKFTVTENTSYDDRSVSVTIKSGTASKTFTITQKHADALLLTTNKYELSQEGGTIEIEVKANIDYEMVIAESSKDWISETKTRALTTYKHTLTIATNEEVEKREGEIYFKSGDKVEIVKVYQSGAGPLILLSRNEYYTSSAGETITIDIRSNCEYDIVMPNVDWIKNVPETKAMSSHTLKYEISPNEIYENRDALIIFREITGSISDTLHIIQGQKDAILLSQKEVEINFTGGTIEVKLESNTDYEIIMPENGWVTECNTRAFTTHTKTFSVSENENADNRSCHIVFQSVSKSVADTLTINQKGKSDYLYFEEDIAYWTSRRSSKTIKIYSDMAYELIWTGGTPSWVGGLPKWIDSWSTSDESVTIQPKENTSVKHRCAQLIAKSRTLTDTLIIAQHGRTGIELSETSFDIDHMGDTITFTVDANIDYAMIDPHVDWIKIDTINQNDITLEDITYNYSTIRLIISALKALDDFRFEHIVFDGLDYDQTLTIKQYKKYDNSFEIEELYDQENNQELEELAITGNLTRFNLNNLRSLAGGNLYYGDGRGYEIIEKEENSGKLKRLDLSKANIVKCDDYDYGSYRKVIKFQHENTLDQYHFSSTNLETIILPNTLKTIDYYAFQDCSQLKRIVIGGKETTIMPTAFMGCSNLTDLIVLEDLILRADLDYEDYSGGLFSSTQLNNLTINGKTENIPPHTFYNCKYLTGELVFKGVKSLGKNAFLGCENISKITFEDATFTSVETCAFAYCRKLTSVELPASIQKIKMLAFAQCDALETISIPESVNYVEECAFSNDASGACNKSLKSIYCYPVTPPETKSTKYSEHTILYVPKGSLETYEKSQWGLNFKIIKEME